jgi:hypothetical protein
MKLLKTFAARLAERAAKGKVRDGNFCVFNKTEESFLGLNIIRADTSLARLRAATPVPDSSAVFPPPLTSSP